MSFVPSTFDLLQWMDDDLRSAYRKLARHRSYRAGQMIYLQGDKGAELFRVIEGTVRLSVLTSDGRQSVLTLLKSGDSFGDSSLIDGEPRPQTAEALRDTRVEILDQKSFYSLRRRFSTFDDALLRLLSRQLRVAAEQYTLNSVGALSARIASRLIDSVSESEGEVAAHVSRAPILHSELATMVGASRQSVSRTLAHLRDLGLIKLQYGYIEIADREGLERIAMPQ